MRESPCAQGAPSVAEAIVNPAAMNGSALNFFNVDSGRLLDDRNTKRDDR
jgi:hypothetical protein